MTALEFAVFTEPQQGASYDDVVAKWGTPVRSTKMSDGRDVYTWVSETSVPTRGGSFFPSLGIFGGSGGGVGFGTGVTFGGGAVGTVAGTHDWGVRPTTFEIKKHAAAEYHLIQFTSPEPRKLLAELDHVLPITDGILRYRIIKLKPGVGDVPNLKNEPQDAPASDDEFSDDDER